MKSFFLPLPLLWNSQLIMNFHCILAMYSCILLANMKNDSNRPICKHLRTYKLGGLIWLWNVSYKGETQLMHSRGSYCLPVLKFVADQATDTDMKSSQPIKLNCAQYITLIVQSDQISYSSKAAIATWELCCWDFIYVHD